jgi:hypothetical protein
VSGDKLDCKTAAKIGKLILLLSSDQPGEIVAAARAIVRTLDAVGAELHDIAAALRRPSNHTCRARDRLNRCLRAAANGFLHSGIDFETMIQVGRELVNDCDLSPGELEFMTQLVTYARQYKQHFRISERQEECLLEIMRGHRVTADPSS